jgi:hypothetical protein
MVECVLWKFSPQLELVQTLPAPGFFCVELKYILLIRYFQSLKNATEFGHVSTSENQSIFTERAKGEI